MFLEMVALKTKNVSDEEVPVLSGHPDEAGMEAIPTAQDRQGIEPQHLDSGFKDNVIGEEERQRQDVAGLVACRDHHPDTAGAEIDGCFSQLALRVVSSPLKAHG